MYLTNESRIKKVGALLRELHIPNRKIDKNFKFDLEKMKDEIDYKSCRTIEELKILIDDYMDYYNNERCQWNLKKLTPVHQRKLEEYRMSKDKIILFDDKKNCCACGACMNICPKNAIKMQEDEYGFHNYIGKRYFIECTGERGDS